MLRNKDGTSLLFLQCLSNREIESDMLMLRVTLGYSLRETVAREAGNLAPARIRW